MKEIAVYTDGGCHGNPGPGGWAYVLVLDSAKQTGSGAESNTTNNRMELTAVIESFRTVMRQRLQTERIVVHTDSKYVKNGITTWIHSWLANGWKTAAKKPVKNQDLWIRLHELSEIIQPRWLWVKGHSGDEVNELCDTLVQQAIASAGSG